jgi:hypothetical protein
MKPRFTKPLLSALLGLLFFANSVGCISNVWNCPEDIGEREHCPTNKAEQDLYVILLVLLNTGHAPPGKVW